MKPLAQQIPKDDPEAVMLPPMHLNYPEVEPPPIRVVHKGFWTHRETSRRMEGLPPPVRPLRER
jgi:hypothetical protein